MKWKSVLLAMCVGMGASFTSCSNDDKIGPDDNGETPTGETGYLSFTTSTRPGALSIGGTKATTEIGDIQEAHVTSGFVAFYSADIDETTGVWTPGELVKKFDLDIDNTGAKFDGSDVSDAPGLPNTTDRFTMTAKKLEINDYMLLVVLNPTGNMKTAVATVGASYSAFETAKAEEATNFSSAVGATQIRTNITMSNSRNLVKIVKTQFKEDEVKAEQADDIPTVGVDRILAKVTFSADREEIEYPRGGKLGEATWALDITNKWTYWVRKQTYIAPYTAQYSTTLEGLYTDRDLLYAEDPNFAGSQQLDGPMTPTPAQELQFNYLTSASDITIDLAENGDPSRQYVLENTMEADHQYEDVTTRILMHANFRPVKVGSNNNEYYPENTSYYYFRGVALSHTEIYNMYQDIINDNKHYPWPDYPAGLQDAVEYVMDPANRPALSPNLAFDFNNPTEPGASASSTGNALIFYKGGMSFYSILIRHFDNTLSEVAMGFGRYGVVRNNVYNVTLNRVNGPGTPNIPDPEGPDDKKKEYISAEISVLPWVVREQGAEI